MRITSLDTITVELPYRHDGPLTGFAGADWPVLPCLLVRVQTEDGLTGWGEAFGYNAIPATRAVIEHLVRPLALDCDARDITGTMEHLKRTLHLYGRGGPTQYALSGLDIALWDLAGKRSGLPLSQMLGGAFRQRIPAYTSLMKLGDPAIMTRACELAMSRGFRAVKLHEHTLAPITAARGALGPDVPLMVDVNCAWSPREAEEIARPLADLDLTWLEEPVWPPEDAGALVRLRQRGGIPLAAGENLGNAWSFAPYLHGDSLDFAQPSVTKIGGVTELMKVARGVELAGLRLAPHSPYFGPGLLATLHIAAHSPLIDWIECFGVQLDASLYGTAALPDKAGDFHLPQGAGLGLDPDPEVIARYRAKD